MSTPGSPGQTSQTTMTKRVSNKFVLFHCATIAILCACAVTPAPTVQLAPPPNDALNEARERSKSCSNPAPARKVLDPFRYGCFCGRRYPGLAPAEVAEDRELTTGQKLSLIERYYEVAPYDALDAACQDHDVCWIWNGGPELECNDEFHRTLKQIRRELKAEISWNETDTRQYRCALLALDMASAANQVFPATSEEPLIGESNFLAKLFIAPLTAIMAGISMSGKLWDSYPHPDERCTPNSSHSTNGATLD